MNKILLVSPHFDDAILSAGQLMAGRPEAVVVTVFGGFPGDSGNVHTDYDAKCGFKDALDAVTVRRQENNAATALLNASAINLPFADGQYGLEVPEEAITEELQHIVDAGTFDYIAAPLGMGHPDHLKASNAVLKLKTDLPIYLWEDLPIRVLEPELTLNRLTELNMYYNDLVGLGDGPVADKVRALLCYKSQIGTGILDPYILYVPERFYKVPR